MRVRKSMMQGNDEDNLQLSSVTIKEHVLVTSRDGGRLKCIACDHIQSKVISVIKQFIPSCYGPFLFLWKIFEIYKVKLYSYYQAINLTRFSLWHCKIICSGCLLYLRYWYQHNFSYSFVRSVKMGRAGKHFPVTSVQNVNFWSKVVEVLN